MQALESQKLPPHTQSLSIKLVIIIILLLFGGGVLSVGIGIVLTGINSQNELEKKLTEYEIFLPGILAPSLWDMNSEAVENISEAFVQNEFVTFLSVRNSLSTNNFHYEKIGESSTVLQDIPIFHQGQEVGTLTLGLGKRYFENMSLNLFWSFSSVYLAMIFLVGFGSGLVIRSNLMKPLESLDKTIKAFEPGKTVVFDDVINYREFYPLLDRLKNLGDTISSQILELMESESKFRTVMETSPVPMGILSHEGKLEILNRSFIELFGYTLEDIPDVTTWSVKAYPEEKYRESMLALWLSRINHSRLTGEPFQPMEVRIKTKSGEYRTVEIRHVLLRDIQITTFMDLTVQRQDEQALLKALGELEEKNKEMERYLYTVSHDLKSPMITIKGYAGYVEKALEGTGLDSTLLDLQRIHNAADKATFLLEDLLKLSRIGRTETSITTFDMKQVVLETLEAFYPKLEELQGEFLLKGDWPLVNGERVRINEVWQNFVENALKYRDPQRPPLLIFDVKHLKNYWVFSLKDNGIGLDPRYQKKIFDIFEKINPKTEGSGIGLAIVKRIVEFHSGQVWASSEGLGQGTTMNFTLPNEKTPDQ